MTYFLGLTGGIATGKTTVSKILENYQIPVIDCDLIAREVVEKGTPGLQRIVSAFGEEVLKDSGELNREKLGNIVFQDAKKRKQLDQLLDDLIRQAFLAEMTMWQNRQVPLVVADVPLLFESNYQKYLQAIMVVYVPEKVQCQRLMSRNQYTQIEAEGRINSQMPIEEKKKLGDIVIDNSGTLLETKKQIKTWLEENGFLEGSRGTNIN